MKRIKFSVLIVSTLVCGLVLTGCGGGSGAGKVKKNEYLGSLPTLYDSYKSAKESLEKNLETESEKLMAGGEKNYSKVQKLFDDQKSKEKDLKEKFKSDVAAEVAKIAGKAVPVNFSDELKNSDKLFFEVSDVKIVDDNGEAKIAVTITAKDDFTIPRMKSYDYTVYYRLVGSNGTLEKSTSCIIPVSLAYEAKSFKKGDILNQSLIGLNLNNYAADRAAFSGIEFISQQEYNAVMGLN